MSIGGISMQTYLRQAHRDLDEALAGKEQAERAQRTAEEVARRAEERATTAEEERDGRVGFEFVLLAPRLRYFDPTLGDTKIAEITDLAYDLHSQGQEINDTLLAGLVNDWTDQ